MSDKNLPAKFNPSAFALVPVEQDIPPHETNHAHFVRTIEKKFHHPHDAIDAGINPFKAYREDVGETQYNVADVLDCHEAEYDLMENDELDFEIDDIVQFCSHFNIQPYDLIPRSAQSISSTMLDAMLRVYYRPSLLSTSCEYTHDTIRLMLIDTALPNQSITRLESMRDAFKDNPIYGLTISFIDLLLEKDGSLHVGFIDDVDDMLEDFLDNARVSTNVLHHEKESTLKKRKDNAWAEYNHLGNRLYREDWLETHTRLLTAKKIIKNKKKFYELYKKTPSVIGRETWPEHSSIITQGARHMSWRQAHQRHAIALQKYDEALTALTDNTLLEKSISQQITNLETWAHANADLLQRYNNRQRLMHHHDFRATKPRTALTITQIISRRPVPNIPGITPVNIQSKDEKLAQMLLGSPTKERHASLSFKDPALHRMFSPK